MEIFNTIIFYMLSLITVAAGCFCLFQKNTINSVISAVIVFWAIAGLYFLLRAPYLACVQILIWGAAIAIVMLFSVMMTDEKSDEKAAGPSKIKIFLTPFIGAVFGATLVPFIIYMFLSEKTLKTHTLKAFAETLYKNNAFGFELIGGLLMCAIIGIAAILISKAALCRKKCSKEILK